MQDSPSAHASRQRALLRAYSVGTLPEREASTWWQSRGSRAHHAIHCDIAGARLILPYNILPFVHRDARLEVSLFTGDAFLRRERVWRSL
eukprot:scaffold284180_cov32-Tisochrysis_lutea.AAC.3